MIRDGLSLRHGKRHLTWGQVLLAANTPMMLRAAMVEGRTDLGVTAAGKVAGRLTTCHRALSWWTGSCVTP